MITLLIRKITFSTILMYVITIY